jgi:CRP-like cAMP-binding protein
MVLAEAKEDDYVFRQGDPGNSFFIIYTGEVAV